MRIEDKVSLGYEKLVDQKKQKTETSTKTETASRGDKVSISSRSREVANIADAVRNAPEIRSEKVDRIKTELDAGTYNVEGKQVAEKIVNTAIDDLF